MKKEVSLYDIVNLEIIRNGVKEVIKKAAELDSPDILILDIAPQVHNGAKEFFSKGKIFTLDIDPNSDADYIADLCENNSNIIPSNLFDIIICTEVLEHTLNPFNAANELYRILKPNGKVFVSTPFNFRIHGPLPDCWRFTEHGLRALFKDYTSVEIKSKDDDNRFLMPIQYHTVATK
jgi:SAM-dependent methyltransferase